MATFLTYTPEGADPKKWDLEGIKLMSPEVIALERKTQITIGELGDLIDRGSFTALHALVWVLLRRDIKGLEYDAFECAFDEVGAESDDEPDEVADPKAEQPQG